MTYEEFSAIALALPDVSEKVGRYEIDIMRSGRHLARLRTKGTVIAIRVPWDVYDAWKEQLPDVFFDHEHYRGYPYLVAMIERLDAEAARILFRESWEAAFAVVPTRK